MCSCQKGINHTPLSLKRLLPLSKDPACRKLAQREGVGRAYIACDEQVRLIRNTAKCKVNYLSL